ncbi:hypothetical protein [Ruminococcus sp.]|uniref:hypothetical protein n=1 Tax=Ruminococcus sp. TaxID=41978 RepID=UPI001B569CB0|nr:hypothetical protein [Ruminococcus sp.]MBP5433231.1 hypothetical protein [Ruminococcus sp.]
MKQFNLKFNEEKPVDMKVYNRIKEQPSAVEYIRQLVLWDIYADEQLNRLQSRLKEEYGETD